MTDTRARVRGIGGLVIALVVLIAVMVGDRGGTRSVAADSGPVFDSLSLAATTVARGDTVTITAHITDATADVLDTPVLFFALPDDFAGPGIPFALVSGNARDGQYHADWTVSPLLPPGKYPVREVRAYDGDGNATFVSPPDPKIAALVVTVTDDPAAGATASATGGATAVSPTVMAASPTARATQVSATTTPATATRVANTPTPVPATATASRPTPTPMFTPVPPPSPGPDTTTAAAPPPASVTARVTVLPAATPRAPASATATGAATLRATATNGAAGPTATVPPASPASSGNVTAVASAAAFAPRPSAAGVAPRNVGNGPTLAEITTAPATLYPSDAVTVTARIVAGSADVSDLAMLRYRLPDGTDGPFAYLRRVNGTGRDGTYVATVGLSPFYPAGTYGLGALTITDMDGNVTVYDASMRPDASFIVTLFVPPTPSAG